MKTKCTWVHCCAFCESWCQSDKHSSCLINNDARTATWADHSAWHHCAPAGGVQRRGVLLHPEVAGAQLLPGALRASINVETLSCVAAQSLAAVWPHCFASRPQPLRNVCTLLLLDLQFCCLFAYASRPRWGHCMSQEALSGHKC